MKKNKFTLYFALLLLCCGTVKVNAQSALIQIIHNSPDYIIDTVDVWANDVKIVNDLPFRKATQMISIDSGDYVITIAKKFSLDTSDLYSLLKVEGFRVDTAKTYLAFITGVVDTTVYAANPEGIDRSLSFVTTDAYKSAATVGTTVELSFFNGTPDGAKWDLNKINLPGAQKIGNDVSYNSFSGLIAFTLGNTILNVTSADSTVFAGAFKLNTAGLGGRVGTVFTSGVMDTISNPNMASLNRYYVAYSNGVVAPLTKLTGDVQLVHNSADKTLDSVDVYINGVLTLNNVPFRGATAFMPQNAWVPLSIAIAPQTSTSVANAFYTLPVITLDTVNYYMIAHGVRNTSQYAANPNGISTAFKITTYKGAKKVSLNSKNTDLLYFHGTTDLMATTIRGEGQVQFLSKNDSYGSFHGYGAHTALDNIKMELKNAAADTALSFGFANLANHQGQAGLVFTSGFLHADSVTNQDADTLIMFVVWPDGDVDSIAPPLPTTGIRENTFAAASVTVYPNPANNQFSIGVDMLKSTAVSVSVKDIMGKTVFTAQQKMNAGANSIQVDAAAYASGMYFVTLNAGEESITQKISVIK